MTPTQKRIHRHAIEAAGVQMYESITEFDLDGDEDTAARILEEGVTFELRVGSEGPGNWTRFEEYRLTPADMEQAREVCRNLEKHRDELFSRPNG